MTDIESILSSTIPGKTLKLQKIDIKKLQLQHEELQLRVNGLKEMLSEKDNAIKSQRTSLKIQEEKLNQLSQNNDTYKHIIHILSKHITEVLKETLPILPPMPQEHLANIDSLLANASKKRKKSKKKISSGGELKESASNRQHFEDLIPKKQLKYYDFSGSEILSAISDLQDIKRSASLALRAQGRYSVVTSHRVSLFETLSFFLSLRNLMFLNNFEVFLPRVLEMLADLIDVERVVVYVYDEEQFYSMAITGEISKQIIIPKGFSHLFSCFDEAIVIRSAYEDSRFDLRYDQVSGFKTNSLACFPLKIGDEVIGVLECANKKNEFIKEDVVLLTLIAKQLAFGIAGKLYQDKIPDISKLPTEKFVKNKEALILPTLQALVLSVKSFIGCEQVNLYYISSDKSELTCLVSSENVQKLKLSLNFSFPGLCFTSKKCLILSNAQEHAMYNREVDKKLKVSTKELLLIPLGEIGVLECINKPKSFSNRDQVKAANLAVIAKNLIESANNVEKVLQGCDINEIFADIVKNCLVCVDYKGFVVKANSKTCEFFEIGKEKIIGMSITQIFEQADELLKIVMKSNGRNRIQMDQVRIKGKIASIELVPFEENFIFALNFDRQTT